MQQSIAFQRKSVYHFVDVHRFYFPTREGHVMRSKNGAIILIVLGVIFLLSNLDILPLGDIKSLLRQWWPLILIIVGVIHLRK